ncbi:MAG TPA: TetR/AcrR family transcriptional regulator [Methylomirabilota bacterium]|nr:TetR/AcrR family transcriptional regulator [Methylomirabilota bacterium]
MSLVSIPSRNVRNGRLRRRYLATRLEILRAAGREFRVRGFAETGMRDIAEAASLSPANLYNYFKGKHEILFFCQDSSLDRMIAALDKARRMKTTAAVKLRFIIVSHLCCLLDEVKGSAAHLLTNALPPRQQRYLVAKRDRYELGLRNLVAAGMRSGEFAPGEAALAARAMLGALNWSVQWFSPEGPLSVAEIAEALSDYLIRGLLAKPDSLQRFAIEKAAGRQVRNHEEHLRKKSAVG